MHFPAVTRATSLATKHGCEQLTTLGCPLTRYMSSTSFFTLSSSSPANLSLEMIFTATLRRSTARGCLAVPAFQGAAPAAAAPPHALVSVRLPSRCLHLSEATFAQHWSKVVVVCDAPLRGCFAPTSLVT